MEPLLALAIGILVAVIGASFFLRRRSVRQGDYPEEIFPFSQVEGPREAARQATEPDADGLGLEDEPFAKDAGEPRERG